MYSSWEWEEEKEVSEVKYMWLWIIIIYTFDFDWLLCALKLGVDARRTHDTPSWKNGWNWEGCDEAGWVLWSDLRINLSISAALVETKQLSFPRPRPFLISSLLHSISIQSFVPKLMSRYTIDASEIMEKNYSHLDRDRRSNYKPW